MHSGSPDVGASWDPCVHTVAPGRLGDSPPAVPGGGVRAAPGLLGVLRRRYAAHRGGAAPHLLPNSPLDPPFLPSRQPARASTGGSGQVRRGPGGGHAQLPRYPQRSTGGPWAPGGVSDRGPPTPHTCPERERALRSQPATVHPWEEGPVLSEGPPQPPTPAPGSMPGGSRTGLGGPGWWGGAPGGCETGPQAPFHPHPCSHLRPQSCPLIHHPCPSGLTPVRPQPSLLCLCGTTHAPGPFQCPCAAPGALLGQAPGWGPLLVEVTLLPPVLHGHLDGGGRRPTDPG